MTLYRYKCMVCDESTDKDFKMGEAPATIKCECGSESRRIYTAPVIVVSNPVSEARIGRGRGR